MFIHCLLTTHKRARLVYVPWLFMQIAPCLYMTVKNSDATFPSIVGGYAFKYDEARKLAQKIEPKYRTDPPLERLRQISKTRFVIDISFARYINTLDSYCSTHFDRSVIYYPSDESKDFNVDDGYAVLVAQIRDAARSETEETFTGFKATEQDEKLKAQLEKIGVTGLQWIPFYTEV